MDAGTVIALVFGVLGTCLSIINIWYAKRNRQHDNMKKINDRWSDSKQVVQTRLVQYRDSTGASGTDYAKRFMDDMSKGVNQDTPTNQDRRIVRSFWEDIAAQYENGELPKDLFRSGTWMYRADEYRRIVEPLDIANYYVRNLPAKHTPPEHYSQHRPRSYCFIEKKWREKHSKEDDFRDNAKQIVIDLARDWENINSCENAVLIDSDITNQIEQQWQKRLKRF